MPQADTVHWNPPESVPQWSQYKGKTRCGLKLRDGHWKEDINDVTCNRCQQLHARDIRFGT